MKIDDIATRLVEAATAHRRQEAGSLGQHLADRLHSGESIAADLAVQAVAELRNVRAFDQVVDVARALAGQAAASPTVRRLLAQALIERGETEEAFATLLAVRNLEPAGSGEWAEATGLMGRICKDRLLGCSDLLSHEALDFLTKAIAYYQEAYSSNPENVWQGLNVVALRFLADRIAPGLAEGGPDPQALIATLERTPPEKRDRWFYASIAEAHIPLGTWDKIERNIGFYVRDPATSAFQLGGTLRQLIQLWRLPDLGDRGKSLVNLLRAALLKKEEGYIRLDPDQFQRAHLQADPTDEQLEAVLGRDGPLTYTWWKAGVEAALSVALVRQGLAKGFGTCFVVRGRDLAPSLADELLVLTNAHVVSEHPPDRGLHPSVAKVAFQNAGTGGVRDVAEIVWSSPVEGGLDASLLRLSAPPPAEVRPLPFARALPVLGERERVYIIGHPNGGELAVSLHDNELLDHEGPPRGSPPTPGCCRVHYRTPTEHGSSGSPVFDSSSWEVIALHHRGGADMPKLNGASGTYEANEGIWIQSIVQAVRASFGGAN